MRWILVVAVAWLTCGHERSFAQEAAKPTLAVVNATIHPVASEAVTNGRILIGGDSIIAIGGPELPIPEGVETIDASGLTLTPGWIDVASQLWMHRAGNDEAVSDGSLNVVDGLDPFSEDWRDVLLAGVTTVYVQPSSQNAMGGLGAAVAVAPNREGKIVIHNSAAGLQMSLGKFGSNRDRANRYEALKNALQSLVDYKKKWDDYEEAIKKEAEKKSVSEKTQPQETQGAEANRGTGEGNNPGAGSGNGTGQGVTERRSGGFRRDGGVGREGQDGRSGFPGRSRPEGPASTSASENKSEPGSSQETNPPAKPKKPDIDPVKQRLLGVLRGEIPIRLEVHNANDAYYALELRKLFPQAYWILDDVDQLGSALNSIRETRLPLVLGPWVSFSSLTEAEQRRLEQTGRLLTSFDGLIGIASVSSASNGSQTLREQLAVACAHGLPYDRALKTVTQEAAKLIGCEKQLGVLASGYKADIIGFAGNPLDTRVPIQLVISHGSVVAKPSGAVASKDSRVQLHGDITETLPQKFQLHSMHVLLPEGYREATVTIANGKIVAIETGLKDNGEDRLIELCDHVMTPSLQSVYATMGLENQLRGIESNSAHLAPSELAALDVTLRQAIELSGLHAVALVAGSSNTLPGQISVFPLSDQAAAAPMVVGSKIVFSGEARTMERYPSSLAGQVKFVRDALSLKMEPSRIFVPDRTLEAITKRKQEVIGELLNRKQVAVFSATNDAEVEAALNTIETFKLKAALIDARHIEKYSDRLKSLDISLIVLPPKESDYPSDIREVVSCHLKGIKVYFAGEHGIQIRLAAARAVQAGMDEKAAIQAITTGLQQLYGAEKTMGGLTVGNVADLIIWSGDPLDLTSRPKLQFSGGKVLSDEVNP